MKQHRSYKFKISGYPMKRMLVCPACHELLNRTDIEYFSLCPYCSCELDLTDELEDFLIEPIVSGWVAREHHQHISGDIGSCSLGF